MARSTTVSTDSVRGSISLRNSSNSLQVLTGTANINGNIVQVSANTANGTTISMEASGNHIAITNNKVTLGADSSNG